MGKLERGIAAVSASENGVFVIATRFTEQPTQPDGKIEQAGAKFRDSARIRCPHQIAGLSRTVE